MIFCDECPLPCMKIAIYQVVCANRFESVQWVCIFNRLTFFHSMLSCHFLFDNPKAIGFHG